MLTRERTRDALPSSIHLGRPQPDGGDLALTVHPDKAISQRATILALLADGRSRITQLADCADTRSNLRALAQIGASAVQERPGTVTIDGLDGRRLAYVGALDAGNSATTARLLLAMLAAGRSSCVVTGNEILSRRPMRSVVDPLSELGARLSYRGRPARLPIAVDAHRLHGGAVSVAGDSAQPVSALLLAGMLASDPIVIRRQTPARDHTERLLRWTGVRVVESEHEVQVEPGRPHAFELRVPGDPSGAAVLAALHLASPRAASTLRIGGVCVNPRRTGFFRLAAAMGADIAVEELTSDGPEPVGTISVRGGGKRLRGVDVAGRALVQSAIDELPLLAALAATAEGETRIRDARELREKDSDRIATTVGLLRAFRVEAEPRPDGLVVRPGVLRAPRRLTVPPDHRIVFAALVLAVAAGGDVEIDGVSAAGISHPGVLADVRRYAAVERLT